ncbi:MAG TPA: hypothetical protein PKD10_12270 [Paracoccaceae bacterium]|nr:hypothetical protein [Paracoccaceae bacterium]HMO73475.1 hypothetical protein [Paracoccaceae bacterium]
MSDTLTAAEIEALFTRSDGRFLFARWGRPMAPVVFGAEDATIAAFRSAFEAVARLAGQPLAETDPDLGANLMVFLCRNWDELRGVPGLDRMIEGFGPLIDRLEAARANQYRVFRFDAAGAIRAAFVFLRIDAHLATLPAEVLALHQAVQVVLLWSDRAFADRSPLAEAGGRVILRPEIGALIRAAHDPLLPAVATDASHALRLAARLSPVR